MGTTTSIKHDSHVTGVMDGWMDEQTNLKGQISQQLLSFGSLLSSGTWSTIWWLESWRLLVCAGFKAESCCFSQGMCLTSDSSLLGVALKPARTYHRLLLVNACLMLQCM